MLKRNKYACICTMRATWWAAAYVTGRRMTMSANQRAHVTKHSTHPGLYHNSTFHSFIRKSVVFSAQSLKTTPVFESPSYTKVMLPPDDFSQRYQWQNPLPRPPSFQRRARRSRHPPPPKKESISTKGAQNREKNMTWIQ